jgi:ribosome maturation factor RimP
LNRNRILLEVEPLLETELESRGIEVVDVQYKSQGGRWVLQVFIDTPEGVDLDTCQKTSELISGILDQKDIIPGHYALEVSSPGLDRVLKKPRDFIRFKGSEVRLKTHQAVAGRKNFKGVLLGFEGGYIIIEQDGNTIDIPEGNIYQARLVPDI